MYMYMFMRKCEYVFIHTYAMCAMEFLSHDRHINNARCCKYVYVHIHEGKYEFNTYICNTFMYEFICACTHVCIHIYVMPSEFMYIHTYICTRVMFVGVYACVCACACVRVCYNGIFLSHHLHVKGMSIYCTCKR